MWATMLKNKFMYRQLIQFRFCELKILYMFKTFISLLSGQASYLLTPPRQFRVNLFFGPYWSGVSHILLLMRRLVISAKQIVFWTGNVDKFQTERYSVRKQKTNRFIFVIVLLIERNVSAYSEAIIRFNNCRLCETNIFHWIELLDVNTFAASYLNTQGHNNSCLKSPASTLVYLTFQSRSLRSFSLNQLRNLSL